jgi:hypothetical protein
MDFSRQTSAIEYIINKYGTPAEIRAASHQLQDILNSYVAQAARIVELETTRCPTCIEKGNMDGTGFQPRTPISND